MTDASMRSPHDASNHNNNDNDKDNNNNNNNKRRRRRRLLCLKRRHSRPHRIGRCLCRNEFLCAFAATAATTEKTSLFIIALPRSPMDVGQLDPPRQSDAKPVHCISLSFGPIRITCRIILKSQVSKAVHKPQVGFPT
jgi:hypothetical protein